MGFHIRQVKSILLSYKATQQSKMKNLAIALFATLVAFSSANYWEAGPCPAKPEVVAPFDAERYLGNWYTVYETPMPYTTRENVCTMSQAGLLTLTMRPMQQATLVKRAHWDTSRMLPSPPGIPLHLKKLLTRPLMPLQGMASR